MGGKLTRVASRESTLGGEWTRKPEEAFPSAQDEAESDSDSEAEPLSEGEAEESGSDMSSVDISQKSHSEGAPLESVTENLLANVLRHILLFGGRQEAQEVDKVLELRLEHVESSRKIGDQVFRAIDDGGICLRVKNRAGVFRLQNNHVALIECKRRITAFKNGEPRISDTCLAQLTCEALLARGLQSNDDSVYIIHGAQQFVMLFEFDIPKSYMEEFPNLRDESYIKVSTTGWMDLTTRTGRKALVDNICALMETKLGGGGE
ncbi:hypothetical protein CDD81_6628 [Ophiocordyceps australis]|uniref:Uncharacterized protein n=1 Tax=Ophiocordyceps australis TaxID=1399860 RepID=A0A2C5XHI3_9HYPO|nr:hypothetical protein CDD81_6628 [Ophiocordyceps australis]